MDLERFKAVSLEGTHANHLDTESGLQFIAQNLHPLGVACADVDLVQHDDRTGAAFCHRTHVALEAPRLDAPAFELVGGSKGADHEYRIEICGDPLRHVTRGGDAAEVRDPLQYQFDMRVVVALELHPVPHGERRVARTCPRAVLVALRVEPE